MTASRWSRALRTWEEQHPRLALAIGIVLIATVAWAADTAISALTAGAPAVATDELPVARAGANRKLAISDLVDFVQASDHQFTGDITPTQPSTDQDDYNPTGLAAAPIIRLNPSASVNISGLQQGADGQIKTLMNVSTDFFILLSHEDPASSTAANRFNFGDSFPYFLLPGETVTLIYDSTSSRWRFMAGTNGTGIGDQMQQFSDFFGVGTSGSTGDWMGGCQVTGTGAACSASVVGVNTTEKAAGLIGLATGTTTTGRAYVAGMNNAAVAPTTGALLFMARLSVATLSDGTNTYQVYCGFHDAAGGTSATDGVYWIYDQAASTDWRKAAEGGGTPTQTTVTGYTVNATVNTIQGFYVNAAWTRVDFFHSVDGVSWEVSGDGTIADGNIPTGTEFVTPSCGINKTAGNTSRSMDVDWMGWRFAALGTR